MRKREICSKIKELSVSVKALEFAKSSLDTHINVFKEAIKEYLNMLPEEKRPVKKVSKKVAKKAEKVADKKNPIKKIKKATTKRKAK